jgi:protoporphyrinogen oxidase
MNSVDTGTGSLEGDGSCVIFGGGLTGLSAAYKLSRNGMTPVVFEADSVVGGLSRTIVSNGFRYDIGGHRFFTKDREIRQLVLDLMGDELLRVERTSKIYLRGKFFDYPLKPFNSLYGLGPVTVFRVIMDYVFERIRDLLGQARGKPVSLEDWVVRKFGRTMFEIYFKVYSEKVWGIGCDRISSSWVEKRIQGLSLGAALKNAFFNFSGRDIPSLVDEFDYPELGIGRISERLEQEISQSDKVIKNASMSRLRAEGKTITGAEIDIKGETLNVSGSHYISTVPLDALVRSITPEPPAHVLEAAEGLGFRDLLTVALAVDKDNVTGESWVYIPEKRFPFGRLHEPRNWSSAMAPEGKTMVVVEYFCFRGDEIWERPDSELHDMTVKGLVELGFLRPEEVLWSEVLRVPGTYPLFEVGYSDKVSTLMDYLTGFDNLTVAGRSGTFAYLNMDHAIRAGWEAADRALEEIGPG